MKKKNVTYADIAAYTNLSKSTISRYFNNPDSLPLENQDKIAAALGTLGYKENKIARILANGKTEFIGVIIPNLYMHYYSEMLNQLLSTYETYGYKFLVFAGNSKKDVEKKYIEELLAYNIEGLIVLSPTLPSKELASYHIPVVAIEREDTYICSVNTDNYMGGIQATSLLHHSGCDILIHINSDVPDTTPAYGRIKGFLDICRERDIPHELLLTDLGDTYKENYERILKIVDMLDTKYPDKKKGIFMPNDTHANVLLNILIRKYGALPDTYRIVGFDNSPISEEAVIPISTMGQQIPTLAAQAMELLSMQMEERKKRKPVPLKEPIHKIITPILIRRETTD